MSEKELSVKTVDEVLETARYDNAVALSDDIFFDMMEDARTRQAKDKDIDLKAKPKKEKLKKKKK